MALAIPSVYLASIRPTQPAKEERAFRLPANHAADLQAVATGVEKAGAYWKLVLENLTKMTS